uniref:Uncharacterized protein n=1 Tax=Vitis vinifera TaxID=29760 RepID=A5BDB4_VITVI|nr:hypothetical protein VITISV_035449 [Vitis vinifera]
MTNDRRFEFMLGLERSRFIRGRGVEPKPRTSSLQKQINKKLEKEKEELKRQVEEDKKVMSEMSPQLEYLKSQVASQQTSVNDQVQVIIQSRLATIL